jgi:hypothetical protein
LALNIDEDIISSDELMNDLAMKDWEKPAWWFRPTPTTWDIPIKKKNGEFIVETDENKWPEILQWDQKPVKMSKKKSENNIIPLRKGWKPEVIKGDKS